MTLKWNMATEGRRWYVEGCRYEIVPDVTGKKYSILVRYRKDGKLHAWNITPGLIRYPTLEDAQRVVEVFHDRDINTDIVL